MGMVSEGNISQLSDGGTEEYQVDTCSTTSSNVDDEDVEYNGTIALSDGGGVTDPPCFGNISVANSSDVHFGNKTFYQGPVTIKQFLYANGKAKAVDDQNLSNNEIVLDPAAIDQDRSGCDNGFNIKTDLKKSPDSESGSTVVKGFRQFKRFSKENFLILVSLLILFMVSLAVLMIVLLTKSGVAPGRYPVVDDNNGQDSLTPPLDPDVNVTLPTNLKLVTRGDWLARSPTGTIAQMETPVPYVIVQHTASEHCLYQSACRKQMKLIQDFHMDGRKWSDIGYSFCVGGDGEAYEGRGWTNQGAHTYGYNNASIGIAFIGTFISVQPPDIQITAFKKLVQKGVELGYIRKDYQLLAARQLQTTQSPGEALYNLMKKWDHWTASPGNFTSKS